jgi:hypothetical protein
MGGAAAAASKWRLTAPKSGPRQKRLGLGRRVSRPLEAPDFNH